MKQGGETSTKAGALPRVVQLRKARLDDVPALVALMHAAIDTLAQSAYTDEERALWRGRIVAPTVEEWVRQPEHPFVVAEDEGHVVALARRRGSQVHLVYVHPQHAGRHLGSLLLDRLEADARAAGLPALELDASRNAIGFYERHGYLQCGATACGGADGILCTRMTKRLSTQT